MTAPMTCLHCDGGSVHVGHRYATDAPRVEPCPECNGTGVIPCKACGQPAHGVGMGSKGGGVPECNRCAEDDESTLIRPGLEIRVDDSLASFVGIAGRYQSGQWMVRVLTDDGRVRDVHAARIGLVLP
jgi:hypothetical protein